MKSKYYQYSINQFKAEALKRGNGIYVIYHDHLSCDAWVVFVVENNSSVITNESQPSCWSTRDYYGDGHEMGARITIKQLKEKFPDFPVRIANISYHTFCGKWMDHDWVDREDNIYKRELPFDYEVIDLRSTTPIDNEPSWIDKQK